MQEVMTTALGAKVATEIIENERPVQISRDNARRRVVKINLADRDIGSVMADGLRLLPPAMTGLLLLNPGAVCRTALGLTVLTQGHNLTNKLPQG
jgi:hypothetical protein